MPTLTVQSRHCRVTLSGKHLVVEIFPKGESADAERNRQNVPLEGLERVTVVGEATVTGPALAELLRRGIPVAIASYSGRFLGSFDPPPPPQGGFRLQQYRAATDPAFSLAFARPLVEAKIANGKRLLQRLNSRRPLIDPAEFEPVGASLAEVSRVSDLGTLRGVEGAAASRFFLLWSRFLPPAFPFEKRSTRPPGNAVNACLSFASALVYGEILSACLSRGLDPSLGCLHTSSDGRHSLPLDLMEPFRPAVIESFALWLFTRRALDTSHFEERDGGTYLSDAGRRQFLEHYEERVNREFFSEHAGCRTSLRRQFSQAALAFKVSLADPGRFAPFRVN